MSAPWQKQVRREEKIWDAQKERGPREKPGNVLKTFRALKKDVLVNKGCLQKTAEKRELGEIMDYFRERKERPKYRFVAPPKPTFTAKEAGRKMDDIKKRLMLRDKGEGR